MTVHSAVRYLAKLTAIAVALTGVSLVTLLVQPGHHVSLVYPATGLGAALLWGFGFRWWPAVVISQFILSFRASGSWSIATYVTATELLVIALFCATANRLQVGRDFRRTRDLTLFTGAALITTAAGGLSSFLGESFLENKVTSQMMGDAFSFWLSDFISILVFTPLILTWRRWPFARRSTFLRWLALTVVLVVLGGAIAFIGREASATLFLLLPIVVYTAIVAGIAGAAASGAVLLFIFVGMHLGYEPERVEALIRIVFVGTSTATGYVLAVVWGEREKHARRLFELAHHDPLTGMYNRHELERRLEEAMSVGRPSAHALMYLDLDQFKLVNDTCGHIAGDRMLQELAAEFHRATPAAARMARLGGDEFACIVYNATSDDAVAIANGIHDTLSRYRFRFGAMSFSVGASIGITLFPAEGGDTADAALGRADIACYVAKENGRHRSHVYLPRDEAMLRWHSAIHQVSQMEMSMENGGLELWRQSIVDLTDRDRRETFAEVLLRLNEEGQVRTSADFLPVAQRFGLMDRIDRWVLENASRHLAETSESGLRLSVNISGSTLNDPSFYPMVIGLPEKYGFDPRRLCLEVTEGVMIHRLQQAAESMKALRARGFDLALDDFGAGVASFAYLQELPVTYVKIDGRLVQQLATDPAAEVIVGSLVKLARLRDIECIAEWVETEETLERLSILGVRFAQGYFLDRPSPLRPPPVPEADSGLVSATVPA